MLMPFMLLLPVAAVADAPVACQAVPPLLAAWTSAAAPQAVGGVVPIGQRADLRLRDVARIRFTLAPEKAPATGTYGGVVTFRVARAGSYRVALGTAAWLDVVRDGELVASSAHAHGPACSGIRKMVNFALTPGAYTLQISGSKDAVTGVMIAPLP